MDQDRFDVFVGLDVGKEHHHATALNSAGKRLHDKALPQDEAALREVFSQLATHGSVLVIVDQPATIGALPVTVARAMGIEVAYLPGLAMRRIADLHPGNAKTDARDAYIIAEAGRTIPHALRRVGGDDDLIADLAVIVGFDDDLAGEVNRVSNRIRGLLTQIHPALERAVGGNIGHPAVLALLSKFGGPTGLAAAGKRRLTSCAKPLAPRMHERLIESILKALTQQTVVVPGTKAAELILPQLASQLQGLLAQRAETAKQVEEALDAHPLSQLLMSMPGVGIRTAARLLLDVGDGSAFPTAGHLAAYAGLAPVTRRSGTSIRGEHPSRSGNKHLKRALFLSAFAALHDPDSRTYYDRKRAAGKKHNAAIICLARRRVDVLHAMLKTGSYYQPRTPAAA